MQLDDRFYTSTEVAEILGVSLRSVYRYLEDGKLNAEVKTATGRHRFTRDNIVNFLYPDGSKSKIFEEEGTKKEKIDFNKERNEEIHIGEKEEQVDWLAKFKEAAKKYKEEEQTALKATEINSQPQNYGYQPQAYQQPQQEQRQPNYDYQPIQKQREYHEPKEEAQTEPKILYYRSMLGGLKDIAQNLDKSARNSNLEYAFTLNAGASLHKPIKPFSTLHAYVKSTDRDFYEKILRLTPTSQNNAQLSLIVSDDSSVYNRREEIHGLFVVSRDRLKGDIGTYGDPSLLQEMSDVLG